jgi:hypothetical protein
MSNAFSKEEKAAMKAAAAEAKAAQAGADLQTACLAAITDMGGPDKELAETLHRPSAVRGFRRPVYLTEPRVTPLTTHFWAIT